MTCPHTMKAQNFDGRIFCCDCGKDMTLRRIDNDLPATRARRAVTALRAPDPTLERVPGTVRDAIAEVIDDHEAAIKKALKFLDGATPRQRNGPCIQAANTLREALELPPMELRGRPSDGVE